VSNLDKLVELARTGNPAGLVHEIGLIQSRIKAFEGREIVMADLPESVQAFFRAIYSVRRTPGRPRAADAVLLDLRRAYESAVAKRVFNQKREMLAFGQQTGMKQIIGSTAYPLDALKPSDQALQEMEAESGMSEGSIRDLVYPNRRKPKAPPK